ncbi:MAG TPA: hypothetical protein VJ953_12680 [Saprospiraceae bacterium]|nr:hypothetical protein [Saprospiraceae bacterium]
MRKIFYLLFLGFLTLSSCSPRLSPLTENMVRQNRWTEDDLRQIQFYLSDDIVMTRRVGGSASTIESGEIKIINGQKVEQVVIKEGTPGIALFSPNRDEVAVSFEADSDRRFLVFGASDQVGGRYVLRAREWKRRTGTITYEDKLYRVQGNSAYASLLVDLKKVNKTIVDSRRAGGRRIN